MYQVAHKYKQVGLKGLSLTASDTTQWWSLSNRTEMSVSSTQETRWKRVLIWGNKFLGRLPASGAAGNDIPRAALQTESLPARRPNSEGGPSDHG